MRKVGTFQIIAVGVVLLGLGSATSAAIGATALAIALVGLALAATAALLVILERRSQSLAVQARRAADQATRQSARIGTDIQRIEALVDAMQRRVVASVDSARVEAAERHRASVKAN